MDIREGLTRISLVWWALVGVAGAAFAVAAIFNGRGEIETVGVGLGTIAFAWVAHLVCRWIIRGFFPARA